MTKSLQSMAREIVEKYRSDAMSFEDALLEMGRAVIAEVGHEADVCRVMGRGIDHLVMRLQSLDKPDAKPTEGGE